MLRKLILIVLFFLTYFTNAQNLMPELLSSSGGLYSGENASLSWTLGEVSINTITSSDIMLTQGFQQPGLHTTSVTNPDYQISAIVYPNPARDFIDIEIKYPNSKSFAIIDINGNIYKRLFSPRNKKIDISNLQPGYYFIAINTNKGVELTGIKFLKLK